MDLSRDIHPLTDFKRNTPEFLRRLKENGHPLVLTVERQGGNCRPGRQILSAAGPGGAAGDH